MNASTLRDHPPMREAGPGARAEPRWPVALAVIAVFALLLALPARVRVVSNWVLVVVAAMELAPMVGVAASGAVPRWLRAERVVTVAFCVLAGISSALILGLLVQEMVRGSAAVSGLRLLSSSIGVWITNVLVFSLLYWQVDRGGPGVRAREERRLPDWLFPQAQASAGAPSPWRPAFVDYLALAFSTATAFSPTDVPPFTSRAKILMMLESLLSLVTIVVVAARAINILGS